MVDIKLSALTKRFGSQEVLKDINLEIRQGEFIALLGPSGCGKSTLLRLIAGLESPNAGEIWIGEREVTRLPPEKRDVALMFQSYALMPHMTVFENIRFPLRMKNVLARAEQDSRVRDALDQVHLGGLGDRYPRQLSGGQQQRVALARAVVAEPKVLLLDEPLSNLDARLREDMQVELKRLYQRLKLTTVFVTHDQTEALALADRVILMNAGAIEQTSTPEDLYDRPRTVFAADFIGGANILKIDVSRAADAADEAMVGKLTDGTTFPLEPVDGLTKGTRNFMVRQEAITFDPQGQDMLRLSGVIEAQHFSGSVTKSIIQFGGAQISAVTPAKQTPAKTGPASFGWTLDDLVLLED